VWYSFVKASHEEHTVIENELRREDFMAERNDSGHFFGWQQHKLGRQGLSITQLIHPIKEKGA
jgi:hypothetical protein